MMVRYGNRIVYLLAALLFVFFCAVGVQAANEPGKPDSTVPVPQGQPIIYVPQYSHDFGEIMEGTDASHDFTIKNIGAGMLNIDRVGTS